MYRLGTYSYIHALHNQFLLKSIVFMICELEYINMYLPNHRVFYGTDDIVLVGIISNQVRAGSI